MPRKVGVISTESGGVQKRNGARPADESKPPRTRGEAHEAKKPLSALSDQELIEGLRVASEPHFNEFYSRYFQRIYNFVYGKIRNHADAEELVQETFTIVFSSIGNYQGRSSLLSWTYGIAKNTTNNLLRRAKAKNQHMQEALPEQFQPAPSFATCTPEEQLTMQRYLATIEGELGVLGDWQVEIFEMRHLQDLSIGEISQRTGRSSDSIRSSLYRVKRLLIETVQTECPPGRHSADFALRDARQVMGR